MDLHGQVRDFVQKTLGAMGLPLDISIQDLPDSVRVDLAGDGGEVLLRRRAEALDALQHIVNTAFRRQLKDDRTFVVDCLEYR
jgi:predicted RNA-binding protein Jag